MSLSGTFSKLIWDKTVVNVTGFVRGTLEIPLHSLGLFKEYPSLGSLFVMCSYMFMVGIPGSAEEQHTEPAAASKQ